MKPIGNAWFIYKIKRQKILAFCVPGNRGGGIGEDNFLIRIKNYYAGAGLIQGLSQRDFWLVVVASWFLLWLIIAINCLKRRLKSSFFVAFIVGIWRSVGG